MNGMVALHLALQIVNQGTCTDVRYGSLHRRLCHTRRFRDIPTAILQRNGSVLGILRSILVGLDDVRIVKHNMRIHTRGPSWTVAASKGRICRNQPLNPDISDPEIAHCLVAAVVGEPF